MRLELTRVGLLVKRANLYTIRGALDSYYRYRLCYQHLRPSSLYKQKALTYFKTLIPHYLFTIYIYIYIYIYIFFFSEFDTQ